MSNPLRYYVFVNNLSILCELENGLSYNAILKRLRTLQDHLVGLPSAEEYDRIIKRIIIKWFEELAWANGVVLDTASGSFSAAFRRFFKMKVAVRVQNNPKEDLRVVLSDVITRRNLNLDNILD